MLRGFGRVVRTGLESGAAPPLSGSYRKPRNRDQIRDGGALPDCNAQKCALHFIRPFMARSHAAYWGGMKKKEKIYRFAIAVKLTL